MEQEFELKLSNGKVAKWVGEDGISAAKRYVDCHRDATVIAFRTIRHGVFLYNPNFKIIE
jgi:hypothetical protein